MAEATVNMYDFNKENMKNVPPVDVIWLKSKCAEVENSIKKEGKYWMLLCRELADYTVFHLKHETEKDGQALFETLTNRGTVIDFTSLEDKNYEIWIKNFEDGEAYVYYLFNYDFGIVEV